MTKHSWGVTIRTIILSVALGAASGVFATAMTSSYLSDYAISLNDLTTPLRIGLRRPVNFPTSRSEAIEKFSESSLKGVVSFYPANTSRPLGFQESDRVATGVVVTSDGWIAIRSTSPSEIANSFVSVDGRRVEVKSVLFDEEYGIVFAKTDVSGLPVVNFGSTLDLRLGEQVFVATDAQQFEILSVQNHHWSQGVADSSDTVHRRIILTQNQGEDGLVFDLVGNFVGFSSNQELLPVEGSMSSLSSLLENGEITRPSLGVNSLNLSRAVGLTDVLTRGHHGGAYLYGASAVVRGSAAEDAGLKRGDIVLSVDGQTIDGTRTLDERIASYKPADVIELTIDRDGETQSVTVTLGQIKQ